MAVRLKHSVLPSTLAKTCCHWCRSTKSWITCNFYPLALYLTELLIYRTNTLCLPKQQTADLISCFLISPIPFYREDCLSAPWAARRGKHLRKLCSPKHCNYQQHHKMPIKGCHLQPKVQLIATLISQRAHKVDWKAQKKDFNRQGLKEPSAQEPSMPQASA